MSTEITLVERAEQALAYSGTKAHSEQPNNYTEYSYAAEQCAPDPEDELEDMG